MESAYPFCFFFFVHDVRYEMNPYLVNGLTEASSFFIFIYPHSKAFPNIPTLDEI